MIPSSNRMSWFEILRAEREGDWLDQVFVPPRQFDRMKATESALIIGSEGSGKTALEIQLMRFAARQANILTVPWQLSLPPPEVSDVVAFLLAQAFDALSQVLARHFASQPEHFTILPEWAQDFFHWFIREHLQVNIDYLLKRLVEDASEEGKQLLKNLFLGSFPKVLSLPTFETILLNLSENIQKAGWKGIWFFVKGLDRPYSVFPERLIQTLNFFLSTLDLFQESELAFKILLSEEAGKHALRARAVQTGRIMLYFLKWQEEDLHYLVDRRLQMVFQDKNITLQTLCTDPEWMRWIRRYAGSTPRGWLELVRPMLMAYDERGHPIPVHGWQEIYRSSPPLLRVDLDQDRVFIGRSEIHLTGYPYQLLRYLYQHRDRACTRSELFYRAILGRDREPRTEEEGREPVKAWENTLDIHIHRLRQAVEWDTRKGVPPLYIVSERGKSRIRLENAM